MAIEQIKILNKLGLAENKPIFDFTSANVISMVGKNGTGKSLFLKDLNKEISSISSSNTTENEKIKLLCTITKEDTRAWFNRIKESLNKFNEQTIEDIRNEFEKEKIFNTTNKINLNQFIKTIDNVFYKKIEESHGYIKNNNIFDKKEDYEKYIKIFKQNYDKHKFSSFIDNLNVEFNKNEKLFSSFNFIIQENKSLINFIEDRINNFNVIYYDCINDNKNVDLSFNIDFTFYSNDGKMYPTANSLINNKFFYNLLCHSTISPKKFIKMEYDAILKLSQDVEFQTSVQNWFNKILHQQLKFKIDFSGYTIMRWNDFYYRSSSQKSMTINVLIEDTQLNEPLTFESLSSGTKNILKLFNKIPRVDNQSIIILDEPETGMHPLMQYEFYNIIKNLAKTTKARFILSTHSMFFISKENENSIYIADRDKSHKGSNEIGVYNIDDFRKKHNLWFDKEENMPAFEFIQYIPYFDIVKESFNKNKINVIVEGATDVKYLTKWAKLFNVDDQINFIRPALYKQGYIGALDTYKLLKHFYLKEKDKIFLAFDSDVEKSNNELIKKLRQNKNFILIGKDGKSIESLFENEDKKYSYESYEENTKKYKCAMDFENEINDLSQLDKQTIKNFKDIFKKFGVPVDAK